MIIQENFLIFIKYFIYIWWTTRPFSTPLLNRVTVTMSQRKIYAKIPSLIFLMNHQHQLHLSCQSPMVGKHFYFLILSEGKPAECWILLTPINDQSVSVKYWNVIIIMCPGQKSKRFRTSKWEHDNVHFENFDRV